jgi:hypothetical protein
MTIPSYGILRMRMTRRFADLFSVCTEAKEKLSAVVASMEVNRAPEVISRLKHIHGVMDSYS